MINIKELRLGSYVMYEQTTHVVTELSNTLIGTKWTEGNQSYIHVPEELNPIPLTEEILLRCGFEKDDTGVDMYDQDYHEWYQKEFPVIGMLVQNDTKEYLFDENTDTLRIRYLHELQNLLSVLGKELEYE